MIVSYEWGLGESTNNKAEAYSLFLGTKILKKHAIKYPIIIGDSAIVIEAMVKDKSPSNTAINKIYQRIISNIKGLGNITFKHVLRDQNQEAVILTNKASERVVGSVKENNETFCLSIP